MRPEFFDTVTTTPSCASVCGNTACRATAALRSEQSNRTAARLPGIALMAVLAAAIVAPQIALAGYALADAQLRQTIAAQPIVAAQLAAALIFWIGLVIWPLRQGLGRVARRRTLTIDTTINRASVTVADVSPWGSTTWSQPLSAYLGITHHVRSTLSGQRHELILVHPKRRHSLILSAAEHISTADIAAMTDRLSVPAIAPAALYRMRHPRPAAVSTNATNTAGSEHHSRCLGAVAAA